MSAASALLSRRARELSRVRDLRAAGDLALQWAVIAVAVLAAVRSGHPLAWVAGAAVIATRQHALATLMHEASHFHLFSRRAMNDAASDLLCALPLGMLTASYRVDHMAHHRHPNTSRDPYWRLGSGDAAAWSFPKRPLSALAVFAADVTGLNLPRNLRVIAPWTYPFAIARGRTPGLTAGEHVRALGFAAALGATLAATGALLPYLLLWLLPALTLQMAIFRMRALAEHPYGPGSEEPEHATREVLPSLLERLVIAPLSIGHHVVHHRYPAIPYYNLSEMHRRLHEAGVLVPGANLFRGYLGLREGILGTLVTR